jgi:hypothetical protein
MLVADREISWVLEGHSPNEIPMARLAEYMQQFAAMLGETEGVHFDRVEESSLHLVAKLDRGRPAQRVQARVQAVRDRRAPIDAMRAYRRINEMVGEDKGPARVIFGASVMLRFPGIQAVQPPLSIADDATVTGRLYALFEAPSGELKARIRPRVGNAYVDCTAESGIGRQLRNYLFDAVRVHGRGNFSRTEGGEWVCDALHIRDVQPVKDVSLREAINALRAIKADWPDDPLADWAALEQEDGAA